MNTREREIRGGDCFLGYVPTFCNLRFETISRASNMFLSINDYFLGGGGTSLKKNLILHSKTSTFVITLLNCFFIIIINSHNVFF